MGKSQQNYKRLHEISRQTQLLKGISGLLEWDHETYMPKESGGIRSEQLSLLAGMIHRQKVGKKFAAALDKLIDIESGEMKALDLAENQQAALRVWRSDYLKEMALPASFVEKFAKLTSKAQLIWRTAKEEDNFKLFAPYLKDIVAMSRQKADLLGYDEHPYDALLDLYEPKMLTSDVHAVFTALKKPISQLIKKIGAKKPVDDTFLYGSFDAEQQDAFGRLLLDGMGFLTSRGRLDTSAHPFSSSLNPYDHRITTRLPAQSVMNHILTILHEGGHALYEMGLPAEAFGSPLGEALSLGMHESQSRWWETRIGLSKAFWQHYYILFQHHFKGQFDKISLDDFYKANNRVRPSLIRVEADEVTYPLHVVLRFDLEKALIEGSLDVEQIPEVWQSKMQELLGVTPQTDREGCLQDVHWSIGAFGYFPSYALGNLYAAQLFEAFAAQHSDWQTRVAAGELHFVRKWLQAAVHQYGRQYDSHELLKKVTGRSFTAKPYIKYLDDKYTSLYGLSH